MTKIYDQADVAFRSVSAYAILAANGDYIAKVAIKYPRDGARPLYAYTHWLGEEMTRGRAGGGGYDKRTAAVRDGFHKARLAVEKWTPKHDWQETPAWAEMQAAKLAHLAALDDALQSRDGHDWAQNLEAAGYKVLNVL